MKTITETPLRVKRLYKIVAELEAFFEGRRFTLDGHLVGSIGEVMAAYHYGLKLAPASTEGHDATPLRGRRKRVEIKTTQGRQVGLRSLPEHLLVLKLKSDGSVEEIYNGPGKLAWDEVGDKQKNGQHPISLTRLAKLMKKVAPADKLKRVRA